MINFIIDNILNITLTVWIVYVIIVLVIIRKGEHINVKTSGFNRRRH